MPESQYVSGPVRVLSRGTYGQTVWSTATPVETFMGVQEDQSYVEFARNNTVSRDSVVYGSGTTRKNKSKVYDPLVFFRYVKAKFSLIEEHKLKNRLDVIEQAATQAIRNGQFALGRKFEMEWTARMREAEIYAKGIKHYIEASDINAKRHRIRGGKIADTKLKDYVRVIPAKVMKKIDKVREIFDDFVIFHYWDEEAQKDVANMSDSEKAAMRDPIVFGVIRETNRLYFIADWEDEYCTLTFDELTEVVAKREV